MRTAIVTVATLVVVVPVVLVTTSLVETYPAPIQAVLWWPWNGVALGQVAGAAVYPGATATTLKVGVAAARRALMLDPASPAAARALGVFAGIQGNTKGTIKALDYAELLSRRDLPTQLALIEWRVQHGDINGALRHYDRALRTTDSIPVLLSTMIAASGNPAIRGPVIALLRQRPPWRSAFLVQLIDEHTPADTVYGIISALKLDPSRPDERQVLAAAVGKLVGLGRVVEARRLVPPVAALVRHGDFEGENMFPPLDWTMADDANLNAEIERGLDGRGNVLFLDARNGRGGELAWQWLSLLPGRYRLSLLAGDVTGGEATRPIVTLTCVRDGSQPLLSIALPNVPLTGNRVVTPVFAVNNACTDQRLTITLPGPLDDAASRPWLDNVAVSSY